MRRQKLAQIHMQRHSLLFMYMWRKGFQGANLCCSISEQLTGSSLLSHTDYKTLYSAWAKCLRDAALLQHFPFFAPRVNHRPLKVSFNSASHRTRRLYVSAKALCFPSVFVAVTLFEALPEIPLQPSLAVSSFYLRLSSRKPFPLQTAPGLQEKASQVGAAPSAQPDGCSPHLWGQEHHLRVPSSPCRMQMSKFVAIMSWHPLRKCHIKCWFSVSPGKCLLACSYMPN